MSDTTETKEAPATTEETVEKVCPSKMSAYMVGVNVGLKLAINGGLENANYILAERRMRDPIESLLVVVLMRLMDAEGRVLANEHAAPIA